MSEQSVYRFRWPNIDLDDYVESLRAKAQNLRGKAAHLITQAEAIEDQAAALRTDLQEVTQEQT